MPASLGNLAPPQPGLGEPGVGPLAQPVETPSPEDTPLTVLLVHNYYQQPGGEDTVFATEGALLEATGHRVLRYTLNNHDVDGMGRLQLAARTVWSRESYAEVREIVEREKVDVVHVHNTLPLASPSVYHAAQDGGAAVVQTLHNFRMICAGALLLRDGHVCHDCIGKTLALPAIRHKCYRGSTTATAAVVATTAFHKATGTYRGEVDRYIALSEFARGLFVQGGLPEALIATKPNALTSEPTLGPGGDYALFAGRLDSNKGIHALLDAWGMDSALPRLRIAGEGALAAEVRAAAQLDDRIEWLGWCNAQQMTDLMSHAAVLVAPSLSYEGWPLVVIEAMGQGTPVVATNHGVYPEMIIDGITGHLVARGNPQELASGVRKLVDNPEHLKAIRNATWQLYRERFTRQINYLQLRAIYADAIHHRNARA